MEENKAINQIKIIDFGLAANLVGQEEIAEGTVVNRRIKEKRGTLRFMAPEVLVADYGPKCDVSLRFWPGLVVPSLFNSHHHCRSY